MTLNIITVAVNNPTFIRIQYELLKRYVKIDYTFRVYNDAKDWSDFSNFEDPTISQKIRDVCSTLNIECIDVPNKHHANIPFPSKRIADTLNYVHKYQCETFPGEYLRIDSDMFLVADCDFNEYRQFPCAYVSKEGFGRKYCWSGFFYLRDTREQANQTIDWSCVKYEAGEAMTTWIAAQVNPYTIVRSSTYPERLHSFVYTDPRNDGGLFSEMYDRKFYHYRAGGNWLGHGKELHENLTQKLIHALL